MSDLLLNPSQVTPQFLAGFLNIDGYLTVDGELMGGGLSVAEVSGGSALLNARSGRCFSVTLTGNVVLNEVWWLEGVPYSVTIHQDAIGGRTVQWPVGFIGAQPPNPEPNSTTKQMWMLDEAGNFVALTQAVWS